MPLAGLRTLLGLLLPLLLAACASRTPLPAQLPVLALPLQLHVQRLADGQPQDWLLVLQGEGRGLRWSLLDPLGLPLARQVLEDGVWRNDGLLPPNPEARELFAALLFALTPAPQLPALWPARQWQNAADQRRLTVDGGRHWQVNYRTAQDFTLTLGAGRAYRIRPLQGTSP